MGADMTDLDDHDRFAGQLLAHPDARFAYRRRVGQHARERVARYFDRVEAQYRQTAAQGLLSDEVTANAFAQAAAICRDETIWAETVEVLIERSSLGSPDAVAARASVSDVEARRVVARAKEIGGTA